MGKQITLKEILAKKEELKNKKPKRDSVFIKSLGGDIVVQEPSGSLCQEVIGMAQDRNEMSDKHMVYNCVIEPNLKDKELQKEFGCVEPTDIVDFIFKSGEIAAISSYCIEMAGYGKGLKKVDKDIKN
jgi:hypothetical protein